MTRNLDSTEESMTGTTATEPRPIYRHTDPDRIVEDYISRGLVVLSPHALGVPIEIHQAIYEQEKQLLRGSHPISQPINSQTLPDILKVLQAPGLVSACEQLAGEKYAIVPFTHNTPYMSGPRDQHWHKDDNGPFNMRKQRHHQPNQIELLYYPQAVLLDQGPTATVPYSQYWTFDHEENYENFAGADHLDFAYQKFGMEGIPASGPESPYSLDDIRNQTTKHDKRMRDAVLNLNWPFCQPFEAGPLEAGSVILYSHNLLHRGNHRRDDYANWRKQPRFMWRFWLFRTTEPQESSTSVYLNWKPFDSDPLTGQLLENPGEDVLSVWRTQYRWMNTGLFASKKDTPDDLQRLLEKLNQEGDLNEPTRVGAAYRLAEHPNQAKAVEILAEGLDSRVESTRRACLFGSLALGPPMTERLLSLSRSQRKWVRRAATFALGCAGDLSETVVRELSNTLLEDPSVYVRSVAADALGCFGRRAKVDNSNHCLLDQCARALVQSLTQEGNRLSMDRAQSKSIKFVRPTPECDVCEGIGIDYKQDRYEPVRSVVRENTLWSLVILSSEGAIPLGESLEPVIEQCKQVVAEDTNVFSVGLAMDVLQRLVAYTSEIECNASVKQLEKDLPQIFSATPIHSLEALLASGMSMETALSYTKPPASVSA